MALKINRFPLSNKVVDKKYDSSLILKYTEKKEESSKIRLNVADVIRNTIIHSLDLLLMIAILPYILYQWAIKNERSMIILKAIVEIMLEAMMWLIFAGVSVLVTAAFVIEELYFRRNCKNFKLSTDVSNDFDNLQIYKKKEESECRS